jgi:alpha-glucosidase (family GH31 glycosyl hydrolase)
VRTLVPLVILLTACSQPPVEATLGDVVVRVEPSTARIQIRRADGRVILDGVAASDVPSGQPPLTGMAFRSTTTTWTELYGSFQVDETPTDWTGVSTLSNVQTDATSVRFDLDGGGGGSISRVDDGMLRVELHRDGMNRASAAFQCDADERFLGFGAMPMDVEHRGATVPIFVSEQGVGRVDSDDQPGDWFLRGTRHQSYFPVPFFVSSRGYGVRGDTTHKSIYAMCSEADSMWRVEAWEGTVAFHLFYGTDPLDVIRLHTTLDGAPPSPPPFVFAPWNDAIRGSANVRAVAQTLRTNHIPSSVIWTEDWAGGMASGPDYHLTYNWNVDRTLYPDVEQVATDLHSAGFQWLAYFNTFVRPNGDHWATQFVIHHDDGTPYIFDGVPLGTTSSLVDLSNPDSLDWMAAAMDKALGLGFDGWMADYGEWLPMDAQLTSGDDPEAVHNLYPVAWQQLSERVLSARNDGKQRIAFVRSGFTGSQAITHQVVWGGDQTTDWDPGDGLPSVLPIALGLGVAGMPFFGSDVGGYLTSEGAGHPATTKELFFRWSAFSALTPILRTHHGSSPDLEWRFDSDADTLAHWKRWATVHMQLYPYLQSAAYLAAATGAPLMRQLALGFPDDPDAWTTADEYLLGPSLLVAPVVQQGVTTRSVYFPDGHWVPLFASMPHPDADGPATLDTDAPLGELPVYALAGTVLVLLPPTVETLTQPVPADRQVIAIAGADGNFSEQSQTYQMTSSAAPGAGVTATWNGAPVTVTVDPAMRSLKVSVTGNGTLALSDGSVTLTLAGGDPGRAVDLDLRW